MKPAAVDAGLPGGHLEGVLYGKLSSARLVDALRGAGLDTMPTQLQNLLMPDISQADNTLARLLPTLERCKHARRAESERRWGGFGSSELMALVAIQQAQAEGELRSRDAPRHPR